MTNEYIKISQPDWYQIIGSDTIFKDNVKPQWNPTTYPQEHLKFKRF